MYNNYISYLAPCFNRASAFLLPHASGDKKTLEPRSPFAFKKLDKVASYDRYNICPSPRPLVLCNKYNMPPFFCFFPLSFDKLYKFY